MKRTALVVVQEQEDLDHIDRVLVSLGHSYEAVRCQEEAQFLLTTRPYDYIVADLLMSARWFDGNPHLPACGNLLDHVNTVHADRTIPIILLVGFRAHFGQEMLLVFASIVRKAMIVEFVTKPLAAGSYSLDEIIKRVLSLAKLQCHPAFRQLLADEPDSMAGALSRSLSQRLAIALASGSPASAVAVSPTPEPVAPCDESGTIVHDPGPSPFVGGELVIYSDRAELLGVKIISDTGPGLSLQALEVLNARTPSGHWRGLSAQSLAKLIGADSEAAAIGCISTLRDNMAERLLRHRNIACKRDDVIQNDDVRGYHYRDGLMVRRVGEEATRLAAGSQRSSVEGSPSERRGAILGMLAKRPMRVPEIAGELGLATKTIHRTISTLRQDGLVEFVGAPKTGCYQVTRPSSARRAAP